METKSDAGVYGAKVQSWRKANPRELLKELVDENPTLGRSALLAAFAREVTKPDADDYLETIIEYWFANNYHSLLCGDDGTREKKAPSRKERLEATKESLIAGIERRAKILLLDMVLPNGKPVRDCTGGDCRTLGAAVGGWLGAVADRVGPEQVVGEVLTEQQLADLYERSVRHD